MGAVRVAVAVVIRPGARGPWLLLGRRYPEAHLPGLWELPGGRLLPGEGGAVGVRREVREETGLEVEVRGLLLNRRFRYPDRTVDLEFYVCTPIRGVPEPLGCQAVRWVRPDDLEVYDLPAANEPVLEALRRGRWL